MLVLQLLGLPQVTLDGQIVKINRRKSRAILYYLAGQERPVSREELLAFFWPDTPRNSAQQILRTTLHGLRQALGDGLVVEDETVALAPDAQVDAQFLSMHVTAPQPDPAALASALDLYRGEFLSNFSLPDSLAFEDWLVVQREHYRRLAVRGLSTLSQEYARRGEYSRALDSLEKALSFDPLQEDVQREAIRLMYLSGDRPAAIRRYDQLRRLLDEEMGVPPMAETRALYDAILQDEPEKSPAFHKLIAPRALPAGGTLRTRTASTALRTTDRLPFTGRQQELRTIQELASEKPAASETDSHNRLILIEGEPGIGKTRLAEEFMRSETQRFPLTGAARELEGSLPYQPLIEALRSLLTYPEWPAFSAALRGTLPAVWLAETSRLLPELLVKLPGFQAPAAEASESRLWEGIAQFLRAIARRQPLILFLDDLHWADASTLGMLGYLVRNLPCAGILFLAATRPIRPRSPLATLVGGLTREERLARVTLARLGQDEVQGIARQLSPVNSEALAAWLMANSEGTPYVLSELVRYARQQRILQPGGNGSGEQVDLAALSTSPVVPSSVYSLIQSRLSHLSEPAQRFLHAGVAAGREFDFEIAARAAALSETAAMDALEELETSGVIVPGKSGHYRFDHTLTMEVAFREVGEPRHRLLHRRVAEAMEALYSTSRLDEIAGVVAAHFMDGGSPTRATPYALRAAKKAANLAAWTEAVSFYEMALEGLAGHDRFPVLLDLGEALLRAGQPAQASETLHEALKLARQSGKRADIDAAQLALSRQGLSQAKFDSAIEFARQVREQGLPENAIQAEFLWGTVLSLEGADLEEAARHLKIAEALFQESDPDTMAGRRHEIARIRFELGGIAAQQGDLPRANRLYREVLDLACNPIDEHTLEWCILAHNNLAYHLHLLGDPSAYGYAAEGLEMAQEKGVLVQQTYLLSTLGEIALAQDDLDQAEQYFLRGLALAEQLTMPERVAGLTANLGRVALQRGQVSLAVHRFSIALAQADKLGTEHLAAQVRLWLVPLLPPAEARQNLASVRRFARAGNRRLLLKQADELEEELFP